MNGVMKKEMRTEFDLVENLLSLFLSAFCSSFSRRSIDVQSAYNLFFFSLY